MQRVRVEGELTVERAENIARSLESVSHAGESIELDLRPVTFASPGAAPRLGNSLRGLAESGAKVAVTVPPLEKPGGFLDGQLIAQQIARHASSLAEGQTRRGTKSVRSRLNDVAMRRVPLAISMHDIRSSVPAASRRVGAFEELLSQWAREFPPAESAAVLSKAVPLAGAVAEACWNVLDHSYKAPLGPDSQVSSTFSCRWLARSAVKFAPEGFDYGADRLTDYLGAMSDGVGDADRPQAFLELTIADDGVGIAARHAMTQDVYGADSIETELDAFRQALRRGGSVKLRSKDCAVDRTPGFGLTNVAVALWRTYGFASLRSGRTVAFFDGSGAQAPVDQSFVVEGSGRVRVHGTILHMLVPVFARGERRRARELDDLRLL